MNKNGYVTIETLLIGSLIIGLGAYSTVKYINHSKNLANSSISRLDINFNNDSNKNSETTNYRYSIIDDAYIDEVVKLSAPLINMDGHSSMSPEDDRRTKQFQNDYLEAVKRKDYSIKNVDNGIKLYEKLQKHKGEIEINGYAGDSTNITIPKTIDNYNVYRINQNKLFENLKLNSITFDGKNFTKYKYQIIDGTKNIKISSFDRFLKYPEVIDLPNFIDGYKVVGITNTGIFRNSMRTKYIRLYDGTIINNPFR